MAGRWRDTTPEELQGWLADATVPWWYAGGWALDLWLGTTTRPHSDIEIGCFRTDLLQLREPFLGWEVAVARNKALTPFDFAGPIPDPPFSLWIRRRGDELWSFELLVEERSDDDWVYRRDTRTTLPRSALVVTTGDGWQVIAPEVQLLYKSKALRPKDEADFAAVLPHLDEHRRRWLGAALEIADPTHPWLASLQQDR